MKSFLQILLIIFLLPVLLYAQKQTYDARAGACALTKSINQVLYNGNGVLGRTYYKAARGLNFTQGSVLIERRSVPYNFDTTGTGLPTSVAITGLPANYVIDKAYLWYTASYVALPASSTNIIINPTSDTATYNAELIGTA